jgi:hypothetical protein
VVGPDDEEQRQREQLARWDKEALALYAVAGLCRSRGGGMNGIGWALVGPGPHGVGVVMAREVMFAAPDGSSISVTSHRDDGVRTYEEARSSAPVRPYLATPRGRAAADGWDRSGPFPQPDGGFSWASASLVVVDQEVPFEVCDLGGGTWAAVGRLPGTVLTLDSRGVPFRTVRLEPLSEHRSPPPAPPELGYDGPQVLQKLDERFERLPFDRVRRRADYWALRSVEVGHVRKLTRDHHLSGEQGKNLERFWLDRVDIHLLEKLQQWDHREAGQRMARRSRSSFSSDLRSKMLTPEIRTWFANRYASFRRFSFRAYWRP